MNHEKNTSEQDDLKQVLSKSFDGAEGDDVPPMPEGLRDRIADQYGRSVAPRESATGEGLFSRISRLFQQPAFAAATAVILLLVVATAVMNRPDSPSGFRGGTGTGAAVTIVLHQVDAPTRGVIMDVGFDAEALTETKSPDELGAALEGNGVRIVIDGAASRILGFRPGETTPSVEEALPSDPSALAGRMVAIQARLMPPTD